MDHSRGNQRIPLKSRWMSNSQMIEAKQLYRAALHRFLRIKMLKFQPKTMAKNKKMVTFIT